MTSSPTLRAGSALLLLATTCPGCADREADPRAQWSVVVTTDAMIPQMGDRLLVELLDAQGQNACDACRREAVVSSPDQWPVSFGIAAPGSATEVHLRVRLYRGDHVGADGQPVPGTTIDFLGRLATQPQGVHEVAAHLVVDCLGVPVGASATPYTTCYLDEHLAPPAIVRQGTPPDLGPARDRGPCGGVGTTHFLPPVEQRVCPRDVDYRGMACVPGGMFYLGDSLAPVPHSDVAAAPTPERLVAMRSFLLDRDEVTVAQFDAFLQQAVAAGEIALDPQGCPRGMFCRTSNLEPNSKANYCTYDLPEGPASPFPPARPYEPPSASDRAINCVSRRLAMRYCESKQKRLPREAEWEFAAGNASADTRYPWTYESPTCDMVYLARGLTVGYDDARCLTGTATGPAPNRELASHPGTSTLADVTAEPWSRPGASNTPSGACTAAAPAVDWPWPPDPENHTIRAMAGNVAEWTLDYFEPFDDDNDDTFNCWEPRDVPILQICEGEDGQPWCAAPPGDDRSLSFSVRGGSWREQLDAAWAANRAHAPNEPPVPRPDIGFRCAADLP